MVIKQCGGYAVMVIDTPHNIYVRSIYKGIVTYTLDYGHAKVYSSKKQANMIDRKIECGILK